MPASRESSYISGAIADRSVGSLLHAARLIIQQGRALEALYGAWCFAVYRPSPISATERLASAPVVNQRSVEPKSGSEIRSAITSSLAALIPWDSIPSTRKANIADHPDLLVVGEYGDDARLFIATSNGASVCDFYRDDPDVKHLHCVIRTSPTEIMICTGDSAKYLDLWTVDETGLRFKSRLKRRFAGYTAGILAAGNIYFGTDFSSRPNYLLRLDDGRKFMLPQPLYFQYVVDLQPLEDRYLIGLTRSLDVFGRYVGTFVFDCVREEFVFAL